MSQLTSLTAISPLDGRYFNELQEDEKFCNEYGLIKWRFIIEVRWLQALISHLPTSEFPPLSANATSYLNSLIENFSPSDALQIKNIEGEIKHDTKAIEYFLRERLNQNKELSNYIELVHFGCTSDDINNLAYAVLLKNIREVFYQTVKKIIDVLQNFAKTHEKTPMLARTHGQPASPTTVGKEFSVFVARLEKQLEHFSKLEIMGKLNGAVGNYNALYAAYPAINWPQVCRNFVESLGLIWNDCTTQIEPHDWIADFCAKLAHINTILLDLNRDIWGYIALDYFGQNMNKAEVGSSTMPHKINPIDFENSEGNLGLANALLIHFAEKLPISRWQRDLSDSTVMRNLPVAFGHSLLAYKSLLKGLSKLMVRVNIIAQDLDKHWEILGEAVQTTMRRHKVSNAYEKIKELTRGEQIDQQKLHDFIKQLNLPQESKQKLLSLTPFNYLGVLSLDKQS